MSLKAVNPEIDATEAFVWALYNFRLTEPLSCKDSRVDEVRDFIVRAYEKKEEYDELYDMIEKYYREVKQELVENMVKKKVNPFDGTILYQFFACAHLICKLYKQDLHQYEIDNGLIEDEEETEVTVTHPPPIIHPITSDKDEKEDDERLKDQLFQAGEELLELSRAPSAKRPRRIFFMFSSN